MLALLIVTALSTQEPVGDVFVSSENQPAVAIPSAYLTHSTDLAYDEAAGKIYVLWSRTTESFLTRFDSGGKVDRSWTITPGKIPVTILHALGSTGRLITYQSATNQFWIEEFRVDGTVVSSKLKQSLYEYDLSLNESRSRKARELIKKLGWRVDHRPTTMHPSNPNSLIDQYLVNAREFDLARFDATEGFSVVALGWQRGFGPKVAVRSTDGSFVETDISAHLLRGAVGGKDAAKEVTVLSILANKEFVAVGFHGDDPEPASQVSWFTIKSNIAALGKVKSGYLARRLLRY